MAKKGDVVAVRRKKDHDMLQAYIMMAIPILFFLVLVVRPIFWNFKYAFYDYDGVNQTFVGLANFKRVLLDMRWWKAVWNTFEMSFIKIGISVPLAFIFAVMLNGSFKGKDTFRILSFVPAVVSMSIMSIIFQMMFSADAGIINNMLIDFKIIDQPIEWFASETMSKIAIIFVWVWKDLGNIILLILAGLQGIDKSLYESSAVDGANKLQEIFYITIPQLAPIMVIIIMLQITGSLKVFDLINVLTGGGPNSSTDVMMTYMFNYYFGTNDFMPQQGYAAAVGIVASIIITIVTLCYMKFNKSKD